MKPMLSATADTSNIALPAIVSTKLDGIRCLIIDGVAMSRKFIPIPNAHVQFLFGRPEYNGLDGELIVGPANGPDVLSQTSSGVRAKKGEPDVRFHVFDRFDRIDLGFTARYKALPQTSTVGRITRVPHHFVSDLAALLKLEDQYLAEGYEGVMLRHPEGQYKYGRSTLKQAWLVKLKRFIDAEAIVTGFVEEMRNDNEAVKDALGHTKRSSNQENKVGKGTLGNLIGTWNGMEILIPTGKMTANDAQYVWDHKEEFLGRAAKFKYFPIGMVDVPKLATFQAWRDDFDM